MVERASRSGRTTPPNKVGYGRPPEEHQFKPGESGNQKGRRKGSKNTATLLRAILDRKIEVRSGSTVRKISVREAILTRFADSALKGDTKSAVFLLQHYDTAQSAPEQTNELVKQDEQVIIDAYLAAYLRKRGESR
jgi:Family of unknown function (DUF5681)